MDKVRKLELENYLDEPQDELAIKLDNLIKKGTYSK
jgi:hypothetical protein